VHDLGIDVRGIAAVVDELLRDRNLAQVREVEVSAFMTSSRNFGVWAFRYGSPGWP